MRLSSGTVLALTLVASCTPYTAGSFQSRGQPFPSARTTRGCVDIALQAALDLEAEGPVFDVYLGNRCSQGVWVDLSALDVTAQFDGGESLRVGLYDPKRELKPVVLGGREVVVERIEIETSIEARRVCATLDLMTRASTVGPPQVLCTSVLGGAS